MLSAKLLKLNLPVSTLAQGGTSIFWAADQILRSDIRKDDIVIFMLTSTHRFPYYTNSQLKHITFRSLELDNELKNKFNKIIIILRLIKKMILILIVMIIVLMMME